MECRGTRYESQEEKGVSAAEFKRGTWRTGSLISVLFVSALQYRDTTRAQLFHRLLSEHKVLVDELEKTRADLRKTAEADAELKKLVDRLLPAEGAFSSESSSFFLVLVS